MVSWGPQDAQPRGTLHGSWAPYIHLYIYVHICIVKASRAATTISLQKGPYQVTCIYIYIYAYIYVYAKNIRAHVEKDRKTKRKRERERGRETSRQRPHDILSSAWQSTPFCRCVLLWPSRTLKGPYTNTPLSPGLLPLGHRSQMLRERAPVPLVLEAVVPRQPHVGAQLMFGRVVHCKWAWIPFGSK